MVSTAASRSASRPGCTARGSAAGEAVAFALQPARRYWLQLAQGAVEVDGRALSAGDAIGYAEESGELRITGTGDAIADVLLFDLPAVGIKARVRV